MRTKLIYIALTCMVLNIANTFAQNRFLDKYEDMNDVTTIYISPKMLGVVLSGNTNLGTAESGINLSSMKEMKSLIIISTESSEKKRMLKADLGGLKKEYEELMRINEGSDRIKFYAKEEKGSIRELIMEIEESKNYTLIIIEGKFTLSDIEQITKQ